MDGSFVDLNDVKYPSVEFGSISLSLNSDTNVEVEFEAIPATTYTIKINASGNGSVSYGNETIRGGSKSYTVNEGTSITISFSPDNGYRIKSVKVNSLDVGTGSSYSTTVNNNISIEVEFEAIPDDPTPTPTPTTYTLSITASGNGSASYGGNTIRGTTRSFTLNSGTSATISFSPDDGYQVKSVSVNGSNVGAVSSYTITVNSNTTVAVEFEAKSSDPTPTPTPTPTTYTLSVSASGNGSATYNGTSIRNTTSSFSLNAGTSATISFNPDNGYRIKSVSVNGSNVSTNSSYTVTVNSNTTVSVVFEAIPAVTYTLTVTAKGNGQASYGGSAVRDGTKRFTVNEGANAKISLTPDLGNRTKLVKLNGSEVKFSNGSYTISNVKSNNTVDVEFEELEKAFSVDGISYEVSSFERQAVVINDGDLGLFVEVPDNVTNQDLEWTIEGFSDEVMDKNKDLAAIIWNPSNVLNAKIKNPNLLLYVKDIKYAPSTINNIVVGDTAATIVLSEAQKGNNFYCPRAFTAKKVNYSHRYRMRSGAGESRGWETIALPFDVQKYVYDDRDEIMPFAKWNSESTEKPFWLYQLGSSGFVEAEGIKANTPYIICMPNNELYQNDYILRGTVTFSAENVEIKKSDDVEKPKYGDRTFIPNFINRDENSGCYALNVNNDLEDYRGEEVEGSKFILNQRPVHPFEAYMTSSSGTRSIDVFDGMTTAIKGVKEIKNVDTTIKVYNLNGQCIKKGSSVEAVKQGLPAGLYIINNKKIIIK